MNYLFITPTRNASDYIGYCIQSLLRQTWRHWRQIIIDDCSTDNTAEVAECAAGFDSRILIIKNDRRKYALKNILDAIKMAHDSDIICTLDGDDYLSDNNALIALDAYYSITKADAIWTQHKRTSGTRGNSREMVGAPLTCPWTMSHLRTFKKHLINDIPKELWIDPDSGDYWRCAYDHVLYRAILHKAAKPVHLPRICYTYRDDGNTDNNVLIQKTTAKRIEKRLLEVLC